MFCVYLLFIIFSVIISGTLTITHVKADDNGELICEASNAAGLDSQHVELTVLVKPSIYEIRNISVPTSSNAVLECRATGNPLPTIIFRYRNVFELSIY